MANKKKTHPINLISSTQSAKATQKVAVWHFGGEIPAPGTPERPINDAMQETMRWALDYDDYNNAIQKLLAAGCIDEDDLEHPSTIAYKRNIREKAKFVPEILTEDEWNAFRKAKPGMDRIAKGVKLLMADLYKVITNTSLEVA